MISHKEKPKMATKKKAAAKKSSSPKKKKSAKWAKNSSDYSAKQAAKAKSKAFLGNQEDQMVGSKGSPSKRIRDYGQKPPKGYMRTGGRYFAKIENMRPVKSMTTQQQRGLFYSNKEKWLGADGKGGYLGSASNQGMYNGETSEANFRKTSGARKLIDADGGTYGPDYQKHAGGKKAAKSRYIMAIGQDGHKR